MRIFLKHEHIKMEKTEEEKNSNILEARKQMEK